MSSFSLCIVLFALGSNSLLKRLYEKDITEDEIDLDQHAFEFVRFWRYRIPITVSHLRCSLQEFIAGKGESTCQVLQKFLEKVCFALLCQSVILLKSKAVPFDL